MDPSLANPLAQAHMGAKQNKQEQLSNVTKRIYEKEQQLERTKDKHKQSVEESAKATSSWTSNYQKWNMWEDAEQVSTTSLSPYTNKSPTFQARRC